MDESLSECWQGTAELRRQWDDLRRARVVAAHQALEHAQRLRQMAADDLRERSSKGPSLEEDERSAPSLSSASLNAGSDEGQVESWPCWRCKVLHPKGLGTRQLLGLQADALNPHHGINKRNAAQVHVGEDKLSIKYTTNIRREETRKWLCKEEILGADIQHVDTGAPKDGVLDGLVNKKNMRWIVSIYVLTVPSAPVSETGTSSLEVYQLSSFRDKDDTNLDDEEHSREAHDCLEAILRVSRQRAPLNREVMRQQGFKGRHLLVIVNPMSGHKQGRVLWEKVEVLLKKGDVPYHLEMTKYGGHARDLVLGAREKEIRALDCSKCSGILVIGGDGTVCEVLNAVMQREDTETALKQLVVGTVPAGSECAFAKMTTFLDPYSATWVLLKGHRVSGIDVMRITQGKMVMHSVCGIGWGLGGKLAEESEALRDTFGPARYLVSGIKSFVKLRGCPGTLKMLVPTLPQPLPSSVEACKFGSECQVCRQPLPFKPCTEDELRSAVYGGSSDGSQWEVIDGEFVLIGILKSAKAVVPNVHLSDGLMDIIAVKKEGNHFQLIKASYKHFLASSNPDEPDRHFMIRKATAVKLIPHDPADKINVDGEVLDGKSIELRVLPRILRCFIADGVGKAYSDSPEGLAGMGSPDEYLF